MKRQLLALLTVSIASLAASLAPRAEGPRRGTALAQTADAGRCTQPVLMTVLGRIADRDKLGVYARRLRDSNLYAAHGGYYVASGRPLDVFEGPYPDNQTLVVARFPCLAAARAFWYSQAYQKQIMPLRAGAGDFDVAVYAEQRVAAAAVPPAAPVPAPTAPAGPTAAIRGPGVP